MSETPKRVREGLVVRKFKLGEEPPDDLRDYTTPSQRVAMVWELCARAWQLSGSPPVPYSRETMPIVVIRPRE